MLPAVHCLIGAKRRWESQNQFCSHLQVTGKSEGRVRDQRENLQREFGAQKEIDATVAEKVEGRVAGTVVCSMS